MLTPHELLDCDTETVTLIADCEGTELSAVTVVQVGVVAFWHNQHVRFGLRCDIPKGNKLVVGMNLIGRDVTRNDLAEQTVGIHRPEPIV